MDRIDVLYNIKVLASPELLVESWPPEMLQKWQKKDIRLSKLFQWMTSGSKPGWHEVEMEGSEVRCLWNQWDFIILANGVLSQIAIIEGQKTTFKQLLAPACIHRKIFEFLPSHRTGGHAGAGRTLKMFKRDFGGQICMGM